MRNGIIGDNLTSVDIVEIVKCGGIILEVIEGFFCYNLECNPYKEFVAEIFEKTKVVQITRKGFISKPS